MLQGHLFVDQAEDQVVETGQEFVGGQVDVREGAYGRAQAPHGRGRGDAVPGDVADDQGHTSTGERNDVEPIAAHAAAARGGDVAVGDLEGGRGGERLGQHAVLESQGGVVFTCVATGVVQADGRAGDEFLGKREVVGFEGVRRSGAHQHHQAQHRTAGTQRHRDQRVQAPSRHRRSTVRIVGKPALVVDAEASLQHGHTVSEATGHRRHVGVPGGPPEGGDDLGRAGADRVIRHAAQSWPPRPSGDGRGLLPVQDLVEQVDRGEVGQVGHSRCGQFPCGGHEVECGADAGAGLGQQSEAFTGPAPLGDVHAHVAHAHYAAFVVVQPQEGGGEGVPTGGIGGDGSLVLEVEDGDAGGEHRAHLPFHGEGRQTREDFVHSAADAIREGHSGHALESFVDPHVPKLGVENGDSVRRTVQKSSQHGVAGVPPRGVSQVDGGQMPVPVAGCVRQGCGPDTQQQHAAVAVADPDDEVVILIGTAGPRRAGVVRREAIDR